MGCGEESAVPRGIDENSLMRAGLQGLRTVARGNVLASGRYRAAGREVPGNFVRSANFNLWLTNLFFPFR